MKYSYESTIKITAESFIKEQLKTTDFENLESNKVFEKVSEKAWQDAMIYVGRFVLDGKEKDKMSNVARGTLEGYLKDKKIPEDYATETPFKNNSITKYSLGVWQKYSSMVFKYLYCIQITNSKFKFKWFKKSEYKKCKCPIDQIIARSVFSMLPFEKKAERALAWFLAGNSPKGKSYKNVSWNKISEKEYKMFQEAVSEICKSLKIIPLEYDLLFWEPANILD